MNSEEPSEELIHSYCEKFFGYGRWDAPIWFVGMEEGGWGCDTKTTFVKRIKDWQSRGALELENAREFYGGFDYSAKWFGSQINLQATWRQLIRIQQVAYKQPFAETDLWKIQTSAWGNLEAESAILEMFALPCRNMEAWEYSTISDVWFLSSRELHRYVFFQKRAKSLQLKIQMHRPKAVVFYGSSYEFLWKGIIQSRFERVVEHDGFLKRANKDGITYLVTWHPTARDLATDGYFASVGHYLRSVI